MVDHQNSMENNGENDDVNFLVMHSVDAPVQPIALLHEVKEKVKVVSEAAARS